jgi:lipoprotein-anchoring transpeptidase ErfK/SrfK
MRTLLLAMILAAGFSATAQNSAQTETNAFDNMTPDEIAEELGLPTEAEFEAWREANPQSLFTPASSNAVVRVNVSISGQRITVSSPEGTQTDRVSTGNTRQGYGTKRGCYAPYHTNKRHWSRKYKAWMPNAVFYYGGFAIHQGHLPGYPASHGCIRTTWDTSGHIYNLVQKYGKENTLICVE